MGQAGDGWSRLLIDLAEPFAMVKAGMVADAKDGSARLSLHLERVDEATFASTARLLPGAAAPEAPGPLPADDRRLMVAIAPGHGGGDPGAERDGRARPTSCSRCPRRSPAGMVPLLTRSEDAFVPLATRMTIARIARADVLTSLHAGAPEADAAFGASACTLSGEAAGDASARMVERHERRDLVAGLDLGGADDAVATALLELAQRDTAPASRRRWWPWARRRASQLAAPARGAACGAGGGRLPIRAGGGGFLSDEGDRARLSSAEGRAATVAALLAALAAWEAGEATRGAMRLR